MPLLATSWKPVGTTGWEFKLRSGVLFHDGKPLTAEDVKFSIDRAKALTGPRTFRSYLRDVESVQVVDAATILVKTKGPSPTLPDNLGLIAIVSRAAAKDATEESFATGSAAIGSGPYKFGEWLHGQRVVLVRNPDYHGTKPHADRIIWRFISDQVAILQALRSGEIDFAAHGPAAEQYGTEMQDPKFKESFVPASWYTPSMSFVVGRMPPRWATSPAKKFATGPRISTSMFPASTCSASRIRMRGPPPGPPPKTRSHRPSPVNRKPVRMPVRSMGRPPTVNSSASQSPVKLGAAKGRSLSAGAPSASPPANTAHTQTPRMHRLLHSTEADRVDSVQPVDLVKGVVDGERCPRSRGDAESAMQRPRAMVTNPYRHAVVVEHLPDIVRVNAVDYECHWGAAVFE